MTRAATLSLIIALLAAFAVTLATGPMELRADEQNDQTQLPLKPAAPGLSEAIFASGCFWCTESDFDKVDGVVETISGYTGGKSANPSYRDHTGHYEALLVRFDPKRVSYQDLLDYYWRHVDFLDGGGQFCDRGASYRPAIFTFGPEQAAAAQKSKDDLARRRGDLGEIAVAILPAGKFTAAENYHQNYYKKNPLRYRYYRNGCGRDARLKQLWPSPQS